MNREMASNVEVVEAIRPAVFSGNATGQGVDRQGYDSLTFGVAVGAIAGSGNMTMKVQHDDDPAFGTVADVDAADLVGAFTTPLVTNTVQKIGYRGTKRYVRLFGTLNSGTSVAVGAVAVLGRPSISPVE